MRSWSSYQTRIFEFVETRFPPGLGNAIVKAVAGSGKSTTVEEAVKRCQGSSVVLAFNRAIAEEMKRRDVNGRTFHSLVMPIVMRHKGQQNVNATKLRDLCDAQLTERMCKLYSPFMCCLVGLARNAGIGALVPNEPQAWCDLVEYHDLELDSEEASMSAALELSQELLKASNESDEVDFDDMLYIAVRDGLTLPKFDFVFVDEAQDTNAIQRAIIRKIMKPAGRLIAVGDPAQAIYGFRGADSNSLQLIADEFACVELPLTVSYRCPTSVVAHARKWVSHIEAAPNAEAGEVKDVGKAWNQSTFTAGDLVVCRTTKPLVSLVYQLIKLRVSAVIMGREIGQSLATLIKRMKGRTIEEMSERLKNWAEREYERAIAKKQESKADAILDKRDCVLTLVQALDESRRTIPALLELIDSLFSDKAAAVTLATIHKSKGLEADRVFWLNHSQCPPPPVGAPTLAARTRTQLVLRGNHTG